MINKTREHGGDPRLVQARFGIPKEGWLDLSTGINPHAYACDPCPADRMQRLPVQDDMDDLLAAARQAYKVPDAAVIVASPGTQALIQHVPTLLKVSDVDIITPTYGEHAPAWALAGHTVNCVNTLEGLSSYGVVVHPNNPDGQCQTVKGLLKTADTLQAKGGVLVVDEAYCDVMPDLSVAPFAGQKGLIVLKSFGKFFGLAGVRLGFDICSPEMGQKLVEKLGPWAVSGPAIWAGTQALKDEKWSLENRRGLTSDAQRLAGILDRAGLCAVGGTDLFRLVRTDNAQAVFERLAHAGILVRAFKDQPTWLRFGLPGNAAGWARLEAVLTRELAVKIL